MSQADSTIVARERCIGRLLRGSEVAQHVIIDFAFTMFGLKTSKRDRYSAATIVAAAS